MTRSEYDLARARTIDGSPVVGHARHPVPRSPARSIVRELLEAGPPLLETAMALCICIALGLGAALLAAVPAPGGRTPVGEWHSGSSIE